MYTDINVNIQLFADGGDGGASAAAGDSGATPGVNADAAGQQTMADRLRELGVPESKLSKRAYKQTVRIDQPAHDAIPAAEGNTEATPTEDAKLPSWDDFMANQDNAKRLKDYTSNIVQNRIKDSKANEEKLGKISPMLDVLASKYGIDVNDIDALAKAVTGDRSLYTQRAIELGMDESDLMKKDAEDRETKRVMEENARLKAQLKQDAEQRQISAHFAELQKQGEKLKAQFPSFDLQKEIQNPRFVRMTAPGVGMSVEEAFFAIHREEILKAQATEQSKRTAQALSATMQANRARPTESTSKQASSVMTFNALSAEQREDIKRRIRNGERIIPGHEYG